MENSGPETGPETGQPVTIESERGPLRALFHAAPQANTGTIMVGGFDGGFDGPADAIYPTLTEDLTAVGIAGLRLDFRIHRSPGPIDEGIFDVLQGIEFLRSTGIERIGLVGHSFGGAIVISTGVQSPYVAAVAALSTQTAGAQPAPRLAPRPLLLVHGLADRRLSPDCSRYVYQIAREPKQLVLYPGATHSLRQYREPLRELLRGWLIEHLKPHEGSEGAM